MKKPEEILEGLMFCNDTDEGAECSDECPYYGEKCCVEGLMADAAGRIRQLESYSSEGDADIAELVNEIHSLAVKNEDLFNDNAELKDKLPTWISADARIPDIDDGVLVIASGQPTESVFMEHAYLLGRYTGNEGWIIDGWEEWEHPTVHCWMKLPDPPEEIRILLEKGGGGA